MGSAGRSATAIELLAAVPSIIYGMWGFFVVVPFMANYVEPPLIDLLSDAWLIGRCSTGRRSARAS
jgi:phosphate transport system permease protein